MKKVTILALHLGFGGGEKSIVNLANGLSYEYEVEIISVYKLYEKSAFPINDNVKVRYLIKEKPNREKIKECIMTKDVINLFKEVCYAISVLYKRKKYMMRAIRECDSDIIISSRILFSNWVRVNKKKNIKIGWEHNHHKNNKKFIKRLVKSARNVNSLVTVSSRLASFYQGYIKNCEVYFIPNIVEEQSNYSKLNNDNIVTVGRLEYEKGYMELIDVFNEILKEKPNCKLHIVGDGSQRRSLEDKVNEYGICDNVIFHGYQSTEYINDLLISQSVFVMTSYQESFGIVLVEAMNKGIPCVAFDSAEGACEIIKNGCNGYLIPDRDKFLMAQGILKLLNDNNLRIKMGKNALFVGKKFISKEVVRQWKKLF